MKSAVHIKVDLEVLDGLNSLEPFPKVVKLLIFNISLMQAQLEYFYVSGN